MQYVINSIINIDKEAEKYESNIKEVIQEKREALKLELLELEENSKQKHMTIKKEVIDKGIEEAEKTAERIEMDKKEEIKRINKKFLSARENLVNTVFKQIINS